MLTDWTPAVSRALAIARQWAKRAGLDQPEPKHLLLALMQEEEGRAAVLVLEQGVALATARSALGEMEPVELNSPAILEDRGRLSLGFERVLANARALALDLAAETTV